jgi:hypothetical protein
MSDKQIFGWTEPSTPKEGYVRFLAVFITNEKQLRFEVRNSEGKYNTIEIPINDCLNLTSNILNEFAKEE